MPAIFVFAVSHCYNQIYEKTQLVHILATPPAVVSRAGCGRVLHSALVSHKSQQSEKSASA